MGQFGNNNCYVAYRGLICSGKLYRSLWTVLIGTWWLEMEHFLDMSLIVYLSVIEINGPFRF